MSRALVGRWGAHGAEVKLRRRGGRLVATWYVAGLRRAKSWTDNTANRTWNRGPE